MPKTAAAHKDDARMADEVLTRSEFLADMQAFEERFNSVSRRCRGPASIVAGGRRPDQR